MNAYELSRYLDSLPANLLVAHRNTLLRVATRHDQIASIYGAPLPQPDRRAEVLLQGANDGAAAEAQARRPLMSSRLIGQLVELRAVEPRLATRIVSELRDVELETLRELSTPSGLYGVTESIVFRPGHLAVIKWTEGDVALVLWDLEWVRRL